MTLKQKLKDGCLLLDGATGTFLQKQRIPAEQWGSYEGCNEWLNLSSPDLIRSIHSAYLDAGSDAVETNTFGASPVTLDEYALADRAYDINRAAAQIARECADSFSTPDRPRYVFGAIGPGTKLPSLGQISFDKLYEAYKIQIRGLLDGGADGLLIETCQDPLQIKAALAAAEDLSSSDKDLVRYVSITVETTGTLLVGTGVSAAAAILAPYPVDVLGLNCATGPDAMEHHLETLCALWPSGLACMPNAGMPVVQPDGNALYPLTPDLFAEKLFELISRFQLSIAGGCCGTSPEHIRALRKKVSAVQPGLKLHRTEKPPLPQQVSSLFSPVDLTQEPAPLYVGERANATGSKIFREALLADDYETAFHILSQQEETGAHVLDLSCGYAGRDERKDTAVLVPRMARECRIPMMIDSTSAEVIEDALKQYGGRALINSINFEDGGARAEQVVPMARRYGAALVALTIDEEGMAMTADQKLAVAERLTNFCIERGLRAEDLLIDPLTFTVCSGDETLRDAALQTLEAIRRIKEKLPAVRTLLGLSNISFGLKPAARRVLNAVFLHQAVHAGLDACIINVAGIVPLNEIPEEQRKGAEKLLNNDLSEGDPLENYINLFEKAPVAEEIPVEKRSARDLLTNAIIRGKALWLDPSVPDLLKTMSAEEILNTIMLPAMKEVGRLFNDGILQLPFVLKSAEVMKRAVDQIKPFMKKSAAGETAPLVVLATVAGDVHDIGKNLVGIILSNNGFDIIDLGIKVPVEQMIEAVNKHSASALGMSGLLVKSTAVMAENINVLERSGIKIPVLLGGAALSEDFVEQACSPNYSGEILYCKDAFAGLAAMQALKETGSLPEKAVQAPRAADSIKKPETEAPEEKPRAIDRGIPVPDVEPGVWITEDLGLDEIWKDLDLDGLIKGAWGYRKKKLSDQAYRKMLDEEVYPKLEEMKQIARGVFEPRVVHGFFRCHADDNILFIEDPSTGREIPMTFPRSKKGARRCLADFFRKDSDICALMAVTLGEKIAEEEQALRSADRYQDYLLFHGLAVMTTEALAESWHRRIRTLWGSDEEGLTLSEISERKLNQSRFGFGYAACPDLAMNKLCCDLLGTDRIGLTVTELFMADPEVSTFALITHHPQAYYFDV